MKGRTKWIASASPRPAGCLQQAVSLRSAVPIHLAEEEAR